MKSIVLDDKEFKIGVELLKGVLEGEQGLVFFHCKERNLVIPLTFFVPYTEFDKEYSAYYRPDTGELLLELGKDDLPIEKFESNQINVLTLRDKLFDEIESKKLSSLKATIVSFVIFFITTILNLINVARYFFSKINFSFLGIFVAVICMISTYIFFSRLRILSSETLIDKNGKWVNIFTGDTNLISGSSYSKIKWK